MRTMLASCSGTTLGRHIHKQPRFNVQGLPSGRKRHRIRIAHPLKVVQAVEAEIGLRV